MINYLNEFNKKWGPFIKGDQCVTQYDMTNGRKENFLNILYEPIDLQEYLVVEKELECQLLPELVELYKSCNGAMFFYESMRLYGILKDNKTKFRTLDMVTMNKRYNLGRIKSTLRNMIIFGEHTGWVFCYDKYEMSIIYVIDSDDGQIVHVFNDIKELLKYYFDYFINEYNNKGQKIHFDPQDQGIPLQNLSREFI